MCMLLFLWMTMTRHDWHTMNLSVYYTHTHVVYTKVHWCYVITILVSHPHVFKHTYIYTDACALISIYSDQFPRQRRDLYKIVCTSKKAVSSQWKPLTSTWLRITGFFQKLQLEIVLLCNWSEADAFKMHLGHTLQLWRTSPRLGMADGALRRFKRNPLRFGWCKALIKLDVIKLDI